MTINLTQISSDFDNGIIVSKQTLLALVDYAIEVEKDAQRFKYLMDKCVGLRRADRDGPECPELSILADIWNKYPNIPASVRMVDEINKRMAKDAL